MGKNQELLDAAREGNRKVVEKILGQITKRSGPFTSLRRGAGVNVQDDNGYTPLHHACLRSHTEIVRLLLSVCASPCVVDKKGATALHLAAWKGDSDIVAMLLAHNSPALDVNQLTSDHETALLIAAQFGNVDVVAQLLARGADVKIRNIKDESPLDLAAQYGRLETVKHLLRARPHLVDPYRFPVSRGRLFSSTPLHRASKNGHKDVVSTLISAGVDPNIRTHSGTALHEAANYGKASVVRILLNKGADLNAADRRGKTVHDVLAEYSEEATQRVRRIIRDFMETNGYESEEDLPPFPVQDYSPTGYPHACAMKPTETHTDTQLNSLSQSSSLTSVKSNRMRFVDKIASKYNNIKSKFSSAPNIHTNGIESDTKLTFTNTVLIGNSKFFKKLSKKEETGDVACNDEFDTISLDRLGTIDRNSTVNRSNRSCPGFKNSLPNISETIEHADSDESIVIQEIDEVNDKVEAINERLSIFEPRDSEAKDSKSVEESIFNEYYEPYVNSLKRDKSDKDIPKPPPRAIVTNVDTIYENIIVNKEVTIPKPAARNVKKPGVVYENVAPKPVLRKAPLPPKEPIKEEPIEVTTKTSSSNSSRTSTMSTDSLSDETNFEDILLSKKSKSFKLEKERPVLTNTLQRSQSFGSDASDETEASAIENIDVSEELNEKSMYLSMTGTLPHKKTAPVVKKKVLFRNKTFTDMELDRNSVSKDFKWNNDFLKETLANYHIRGTGHCIYQGPSMQEFIEVFNRETLYKDVEPFTKVKRSSYFETAICFCKPRPPKLHNSAEDLLEIEDKVTIDHEALKSSREMSSTSFKCFCDTGSCKFHAKNRESPINLIVKFSAVNKSISTPNLTLAVSPLSTPTKSKLSKINSVPHLEDPYAVVDIKDIVSRVTPSAPEMPSLPSTISSYGPYSLKDISDAISDSHSIATKKSSSEYSEWTLQSCNSNASVFSYKSCLDSSDDGSDGEISDTDTVKSSAWSHTDSFRFGHKDRIKEESFDTIVEEPLKDRKDEGFNARIGKVCSDIGESCKDKIEKESCKYSDESIKDSIEDQSINNTDEPFKHIDDSAKEAYEEESGIDCKEISLESDVSVLSSLERGGCGVVRSGSGRRRWEEADGTSEGDALSLSSAASSCAAHHMAQHYECNKISPTPPKKPPRRNLSVSPTHANSPSSGYSYELRAHARSQDDLDDIQGAKHYLKHGRSVDQYVDSKLSYSEYEETNQLPIPNPRPSVKPRTQPVAITAMYENVIIKEQNPKRKLRRSMDPEREKSSLESLLDSLPSDCEKYDGLRIDVPLSPSHYNAPPTPDHPPPSAKQAENSIHERIRPLSQLIMEVVEEIRIRKKSEANVTEQV